MTDKIEDFAVNSERWLSLEDFEGEIWKDIPGYDGCYRVSNMGRIKSLDRFVKIKGWTLEKGCILKASPRGQYLFCHLSKGGKKTLVKFHRIVCSAFHENKDNLPEVNHKNEIKNDNRADNLEWCSRSYNARYGTAVKRIREKTINHPSVSKRVFQFDLDGKHIATYPSVREAGRITGITVANIQCVCRDGKSATAGGFLWSYLFTPEDIMKKVKRIKRHKTVLFTRKVVQYDKNNNYIATYNSIIEASSMTGICKTAISACCRHYGYYHTAGGYKWEYESDEKTRIECISEKR